MHRGKRRVHDYIAAVGFGWHTVRGCKGLRPLRVIDREIPRMVKKLLTSARLHGKMRLAETISLSGC